MRKPKFVDSGPDSGNRYIGSTKHNDLSQRETLELTMLSLATVLGVSEIKRGKIARGDATIYRWRGAYMSASNVVLDMALELAAQAKAARKQARLNKAKLKAEAALTEPGGC